MKFRWLLIIFVMILLGVMMYLWMNADRKSSEPEIIEPQVETSRPKSEHPLLVERINADFSTLSVISPDLEIDSEKQNILDEISDRQFSEDDYVELYSMAGLMAFCSQRDKLNQWFGMMQGFVEPKQQATLDAVNNNCDDYQSRYPKIIGMDRKKILEQFEPRSHLGQLLKKRQYRDTMTRAEQDENNYLILLKSIETQNAVVAIESAISQRYNYRLSVNFDNILGSHDSRYLSQISQLAIAQIACGFQQAQVCQADGIFMALICSQQADSCGTDFYQWYQQNTLPGMRNDVERLAEFFRNTAK